MSEKLNKHLSQKQIPNIASQPKKVQEITKNNIDKILNWEIDFYSYRWDPIIYSHLNQTWYDVKGETYRDYWHTIFFEDRLVPLTLEEFNKEFVNFWDYLKSKFFLLSQLNNLKIYINEPELFIEDLWELLSKKFSPQENIYLIKLLKEAFSMKKINNYSNDILIEFHIIFMIYKLVENWIEYEDVCDFIENSSSIPSYRENYDKTGYYKNYELINDMFELVNCYYIYFSQESNKYWNINALSKNISNNKLKQEVLSLISIIDFQNKFKK